MNVPCPELATIYCPEIPSLTLARGLYIEVFCVIAPPYYLLFCYP